MTPRRATPSVSATAAGEGDRLLAGGDAAAEPRGDLHEDADGRRRPAARRRRSRSRPVDGVHRDLDVDRRGEGGDARRLAGADHLVGDQDVVAELRRDLRLADGGAGEAGARAGGELAAGDLRRLVRLEVRPQLAGPSAKKSAMRRMFRSMPARRRRARALGYRRWCGGRTATAPGAACASRSTARRRRRRGRASPRRTAWRGSGRRSGRRAPSAAVAKPQGTEMPGRPAMFTGSCRRRSGTSAAGRPSSRRA